MEGALKADATAVLCEWYSHGDAARRARLCEAILRHVRKHPDVADTAGGIVKWWLPRTGYEDARDHIDAVLEDMVNRHWLRAQALPDGEILYRRGDAAGFFVALVDSPLDPEHAVALPEYGHSTYASAAPASILNWISCGESPRLSF